MSIHINCSRANGGSISSQFDTPHDDLIRTLICNSPPRNDVMSSEQNEAFIEEITIAPPSPFGSPEMSSAEEM